MNRPNILILTTDQQQTALVEPDHPCQLISYCISNVDLETRAMLKRCAAEVVEDMCLQRCGVCFERPFLIADDEVVIGNSHDEIVRMLGISSAFKEE